jgi:ribosomal protein S18 acetylase RimI-like enzyme
MHSVKISVATKADVAAVAHLFDAYRQFYEYPPDLALASSYIAERIEKAESVILLAQDANGEALGFCQLYPTFCSLEAKPIYALYDLYVAPAARGAGIGNLLLLAAENSARAHGMCRLDLTTAKTNLPAQSAYEALGWVRDEVYFSYSKVIGSQGA